MLKIGLTGGIGAGKSTVAEHLARLGAIVLDADKIAREVVRIGTPGLARIVELFGPEVTRRDGELDRAALARVVFGDDDRRHRLEAIVHPLVAARTAELAADAPPEAVVVHDVPLLVENRLGPQYQLVVVVHAPMEQRVARLIADRGMTAEQAHFRMAAQAGDEARAAAADVWLDNSGGVAQLQEVTEKLWFARLVLFAENLREHRPAARGRELRLVPPERQWAAQAARLIARVQPIAGERAQRIDHIGGTAVPGLDAEDVIDLQIVVADLGVAQRLADDLVAAGLLNRGVIVDEPRGAGGGARAVLAVNADPGRAVDCLIRPSESAAWREAIAWRDALRRGGRE